MDKTKSTEKKLNEMIRSIKLHDHLCLIYKTKEEQFAALIPFIKIGLERKEKCVYVADENTSDEVLHQMKIKDIDVDKEIAAGNLAVLTKREAYLKRGYFNPDWMIRFLKNTTEEAKAEGYSGLRVTGEMTWMLGGEPGTELLIEYEAKLNNFFPAYDAVAICQYNSKKFSPEIIRDIISTHPKVIYGGLVCDNFYYVPPEIFLHKDGISKEVERILKNIQEREEIEDELRLATQRLENIYQNTPAAIFRTSLSGKILAANKTFLKMLGLPEDCNFSRINIRSFYNNVDDRNKWLKLLDTTDIVKDYEVQIRKADGTVIWLQFTVSAVRNLKGGIEYFEGTSIDITDRKKSMEEIERLASIVESSDDAIYSTDLSRKITSWNKGAEKVYGYSANEAIGNTITLLVPPDMYDEIKELDDKKIKGEIISRLETVRIKKDGKYINVSLNISPIKNSKGEIIGSSTIAHDITDRKKYEERLRKSSLYARSLIEASLDPLVTISPQGKITDVNKATEIATGKSRQQLIGKDFSDYFTEPDKAREGYLKVLSEGFVKDYPLTLLNKSGATTDVLYNATVYRNEEGDVQGVFAAARDITELKRTEENIIKLNRVYAVLSNINQLIVREKDEQKLFDESCRIAVKDGKFRMAWIGKVNEAVNKVDVISKSGYTNGYLDKVNIDLSDAKLSSGPTGMVVKTLKHFIANNIAADERMKPWKENAVKNNYRSSASFPIITFGKIYGILNLYSETESFFDDDEIKLLDEMAMDISFALETIEIEKQKALAEIKVYEVKQRFDRLVSELNDVVWTAAYDGSQILDVNDAFENLFGIPIEEFKKNPAVWIESVHPNDIAIAESGNKELYEKGKSQAEYRIVKPDGKIVWIMDRRSLIYDESGRTVQIGGIAKDITRRKEAEELIRLANAYNRSLLEASLDPLVTINAEGKITDVNEAAITTTGVERNLLIGDDFSNYFTEPDKAREGYLKVLSQGFVKDYPLTIKSSSGKLTEVIYNASLYKNESGETVGVFAAARDISERKKAEEKIRRLNRVYVVLSNINQTIIRSQDKSILLNEVCKIAVEDGLYKFVWIGLTDEKNNQIVPAAFNGMGKEFLDKVHGAAIHSDHDKCPVCTIITRDKIVVCNNIMESGYEKNWKEEATKAGLHSVTGIPLKANNKVFGVINFFAPQIDFFDELEVKLLEELSSDLSFAYDFIQKEEQRKTIEFELEKSEAQYHALFKTAVDTIFLIDKSTGNILEANPAAAEMYGYSNSENCVMNIASLSSQPEDTLESIHAGIERIPIRYHKKRTALFSRLK